MQLQLIIMYILATICLSARGCRLNIEPRTLTTTSTSEGQFSAACSCIGAAEDSYYYTWYRHGKLLMTTDRVRLELNRSDRIIFRGIDVTDEGEYVCVATSRDNSVSSNSTLTVYFEPENDDNIESNDLSIGVGSTLELPCPVKSLDDHSTLTITWRLSPITQLSTDKPRSGRFSFVRDSNGLLLRDAQVSDSGEYVCHASNRAGGVTFTWIVRIEDFTRESVDPTSSNGPPLTSDNRDITTTHTVTEETAAYSLLSSPLYLTLIIIAFTVTCTLILITVIISVACVCAVCYHSKLMRTDEILASCTHKTPPLSTYPSQLSQMSDYMRKTGYANGGPSPALSLQSLGSHINNSTRRIAVPPPNCVTDTTSLESPMGQSQNLTPPSQYKHPLFHLRSPSDQGEDNYSSQGELACPRYCPSVTMSEPRMMYANSLRLTPRLQPKKHSLPDRIEDSNPHPLSQTQSSNSPYTHMPGNSGVHEVDV